MGKLRFIVVLFDKFETLDVFGPVEVVGSLPEKYIMEFYSPGGESAISSQSVRVETMPLEGLSLGVREPYVLFVPGGMGTRKKVDDAPFISALEALAKDARYVLTVCTGSALLAKTELLKGLKATGNKRAFDWTVSIDPEVDWQASARWVRDGKFYTSSGVSAGIDMTLGFVSDVDGTETAEELATRMEYIWNKDKDKDPFAAFVP